MKLCGLKLSLRNRIRKMQNLKLKGNGSIQKLNLKGNGNGELRAG